MLKRYNNMKIFLEILYSFIGSLCFGFIFNIRGKKIIFAGIGGAISQGFYAVFLLIISSSTVSYLFATIITAVYAEILARIEKSPATVFLVPSIIPLVPGGMIYYTMVYYLSGENSLFFNKFLETLGVAGALAMGILIVSSVNKVIRVAIAKRNKRKLMRSGGKN